MGLLVAAAHWQQRLADVCAGEGITPDQYNVLRILRGAGGELPVMDVRDRMIEQAPGITALVDRLEDKGLLLRRNTPSDQRVVLCRLTREGRQLVDALDTAIDAADDETFAALTEGQIEDLIRLLDLCRASLPAS